MQMRRTATLMTLLAAEAGTVLILLDLDPHGRGLHPASFTNAPPEDAVVAVARLLALALALWLLATTAIYALARASRVPALLRAVQWTTLPSVRRIVDGVLVTTIVAGSTVAPSALASAAPIPDSRPVVDLEQRLTQPEPVRLPAYQPHAAGDFAGSAPVYQPRAAGDPPPTATAVGSPPNTAPPPDPTATVVPATPALRTPAPVIATYTVRPGDSLWRIAAHRAASESAHLVPGIGQDEVRTYWTHLVAINRDRLRSRDSNLIYPGEVLLLPSPSEGPWG
jgi:hypothetical protein